MKALRNLICALGLSALLAAPVLAHENEPEAVPTPDGAAATETTPDHPEGHHHKKVAKKAKKAHKKHGKKAGHPAPTTPTETPADAAPAGE